MRVKDFIWFLRKWKPVKVTFRSPKFYWRMACHAERLEKYLREKKSKGTSEE